MNFERSKSRELLAYLVDRRGSAVTSGELRAILWEDAEILYSEQAPNVEAPRTGYTFNSYLWFMIVAMAAIVAAVMGEEFTRRKLCK